MLRLPALIVGSAAIHALAFPPWGITSLAWVSLVPFFVALRPLRSLRAAAAGWVWGTTAIWFVAAWVPSALHFYYQQPWWFCILFCIVGSQILWGAYYAFFAGVVRQRAMQPLSPLLLSGVWVTAELGRSQLLTGEPWMLLGYSLVPNLTMTQAADIGGVYLLSFVVVFVNASLANAICAWAPVRRGLSDSARVQDRSYHAHVSWFEKRAAARYVMTASALLISVFVYGSWRLRHALPDAPSVRVAVIQGNTNVGAMWREEFYGVGLSHYLRTSLEAADRFKPDVLVWPESAVTFFPAYEPEYLASMTRMLKKTGADLLLGAPHYDGSDVARPQYYNSAFYLTAADQITGRYDKSHLLPFGEYFPLKAIDFLRRHFERVRTFTAGQQLAPLETRLGSTAVVICFEAIFPDLVRRQMADGAEILVNLSNDAWLGRGAGPEQHLSMVQLRAVEHRTWVIRATITGVSALIDPFGRVVARSDLFTSAILEGSVDRRHVDTVYQRFGDWFAYACAIGTFAFLATRLGSNRASSTPP